MSLPRPLYLALFPLLTACQYLPHAPLFTPPENEPNPAWIRIVDYTQHAEIFQYANGTRTGGSIRRGQLPFIHTQDMGMPKAGQDLTFDFYETPVHPGLETDVHMSWEGDRTQFCFVTAKFTPKAGHYYQFTLSAGYNRETCTMYPTLVERDAQGDGWHLTPNPDVTYPHGSNQGKTIYGNEQYRDPNYKGFQPGI